MCEDLGMEREGKKRSPFAFPEQSKTAPSKAHDERDGEVRFEVEAKRKTIW